MTNMDQKIAERETREIVAKLAKEKANGAVSLSATNGEEGGMTEELKWVELAPKWFILRGAGEVWLSLGRWECSHAVLAKFDTPEAVKRAVVLELIRRGKAEVEQLEGLL